VRASHEPRQTQERILCRLLKENSGCRYGEQWRFDSIDSVKTYQELVPIVTYDELEPWIERIKQGERGVLTAEPVLMMEKTGGSAAPAKYIPYTATLRREFQTAVSTWLYDLYSHRPRMLSGGAYWSISPTVGEPETTAGGLPVGFGDDVEYFGRMAQWVLGQLLVVPHGVSRIPDIETNRYVTLRFLLAHPQLRFVSVWNPSFLTLLFKSLAQFTPQLLQDIRTGRLTPPRTLPAELETSLLSHLRPDARRADQLAELQKRHGSLRSEDIWPDLRLISCWTSAAAGHFLPELQALFPQSEVQGKGLLATEGVVTIPLTGHPGAAVALNSHFYEFIDIEAPAVRPRLVDELEPDHTYAVLISTGGGLYRYALQDGVRVMGMVNGTPLLEFIGKTAQVVDLCGEKLSEARVGIILEQALAHFPGHDRFAMLAPEWADPPFYTVFVAASAWNEAELQRFVTAVEDELMQGHHYAYCRQLGQLGRLQGINITGGVAAALLTHGAGRGQRLGDIKHTYLQRECGWTERLKSMVVT